MKCFETRMVVAVLGLCLLLAVDVPTARADFVFGEAVNLGPPVNTSLDEYVPWITPDGLSLFFGRSGTRWIATRPTKDAPWEAPVSIGGGFIDVCRNFIDVVPGITTADGLEVYFHERDREGGYGSYDLWMLKRDSRDSEWGPVVNLGPAVNTSAEEFWPTISPDGLELYFSGWWRPGTLGSSDLWVTRRATRNDPWTEPVNLGPLINSTGQDTRPRLSADGLVLVFDSARPGVYGWADLYMIRRTSLSAPWGPPVNLGPQVNTSWFEECAFIAADGSAVYFDRVQIGPPNIAIPNSGDLWYAPILPIVDFNGDGVVDTKDLARLIDSWGQADPLCDIGPFPWGDGMVDAADLEVLMSYWGQQVDDPTLVGHWPFDEAEGMIAHDLAWGKDATILGLAQWQPEGGKIGGALELDGNTFATATSPVNPASGPFSVLAWVHGGAPGQVILSQQNGANWLMADPATGALMTDLAPPSRTAAPPLISEVVITDGNWHRIAFTWDGANRWLYVDGVLVAEDTRDSLPSCSGKLVFGAGKDMAPGTFFTGLIDEVRIYNRVVWP